MTNDIHINPDGFAILFKFKRRKFFSDYQYFIPMSSACKNAEKRYQTKKQYKISHYILLFN